MGIINELLHTRTFVSLHLHGGSFRGSESRAHAGIVWTRSRAGEYSVIFDFRSHFTINFVRSEGFLRTLSGDGVTPAAPSRSKFEIRDRGKN